MKTINVVVARKDNGLITTNMSNSPILKADTSLQPVSKLSGLSDVIVNANSVSGSTLIYDTNSNNFIVGLLPNPDSGVIANTYGNSSFIPVLTINSKGVVTNASSVSVTSINSFSYSSTNNTLSISTKDGGLYNAVIDSVNNFSVTGVLNANTINATSFSGTANNSLFLNGNSATTLLLYTDNAYSNAVTYVNSKSYVNTSQLSSNLSSYQTTAGLAANTLTLTSNNSNYLGGLIASSYANNSTPIITTSVSIGNTTVNTVISQTTQSLYNLAIMGF